MTAAAAPCEEGSNPTGSSASMEWEAQIEPLLVTPEVAARMLSIGRTTMYELIRIGAIKTVTIGRSRRVPVCELRRLVGQLMGVCE
jgi:excisionase family DNA binding protein